MKGKSGDAGIVREWEGGRESWERGRKEVAEWITWMGEDGLGGSKVP